MNNYVPREKKLFEHWHIVSVFLIFYDIVAVNAAYALALWFRFDCQFSAMDQSGYMDSFLKFAPFYTVICIAVFVALRLYQSIWQFAGFSEILRTAVATVITCVFQIAGTLIFTQRMPISYYLFGTGLQFALTIGIRFSYRFVLLERERVNMSAEGCKRAMLIGAGAAGQLILKDLHRTTSAHLKVCCIIDDNPNKFGRYIEGIPIVGGREDIMLNVEKYRIETILLAIPSVSAKERRDILNICKETGCEMKILPGMYQFVNDEQISTNQMKDVAVEDLLGRDPISVNMDEIFHQLSGKVILVTGGGGSIGSELCRQIAAHNPKQLIIFDVYENNAYEIEQELRSNYPNLNLLVLIGSVRDTAKLNQVFSLYRPEIVYHAAAHKHVPLMETSPCEAIKNNAVGTYKTALAAMTFGCKRFVLISTDKAVNPTNIMGASKRLCEMIIQSMQYISQNNAMHLLPHVSMHEHGQPAELFEEDRTKTEFVAVRFGNVLGSNGSVIPLFKKQIAKGGPVTVTHPDIIRYFMTIPEAASLVLQAGTYAQGGEIFVLNMGDPVKIDTLARNLIKLSGYKPDVDIDIVYTGLRPGEKLYEEKLMQEEGLKTTPNKLIHIGQPIPLDIEKFMQQLEQLAHCAYANDEHITELVEQVVDTYHPNKIGV